jgi:hypothetical protein
MHILRLIAMQIFFTKKIGKVKFWSKMAIVAIRAKIFKHIISEHMNLNFKQKNSWFKN